MGVRRIRAPRGGLASPWSAKSVEKCRTCPRAQNTPNLKAGTECTNRRPSALWPRCTTATVHDGLGTLYLVDAGVHAVHDVLDDVHHDVVHDVHGMHVGS